MLRKLIPLIALMAALCPVWARAGALPAGALMAVDLDAGPRIFEFTPESGSVYDVCLFPAEEGARAEASLYQGGALLGRGEGLRTVLSARLSPSVPCVLELSGAGRVRLEVARQALCRCFDRPMALDAGGDGYSKAIANPGDAHWYAVEGRAGVPLLCAGLPSEAGLKLAAGLFDDGGRLLAEAARTAGGAFLMDFTPAEDRVYRIRVSAPEGGVGMYALRVAPIGGTPPEALSLRPSALTLNGHESRPLAVAVSPVGASEEVLWESSDPAVARVSQAGVVTGMNPGVAVITASAAGAVTARCRVEVLRVPVTGLRLITREIDMDAGDDLALEWALEPENASETGVRFEAAPRGIVEVDENGVLRALEEGAADVTLYTLDGGFRAVSRVRVHPAPRRYRALLVGEQNYAATVASVRLGSANSVAGMRSMLGELSFDGSRFEISTALDASRDGVLKALREAFDGASDGDFSLFYITCHGEYRRGMTRFRMYDGSVLTAQELRQALDAVPGEIAVLIDCCGSGGALAAAGGPDDILMGVAAAFGGATGPAVFGGSRFRVLASASVEQDSYRVAFDDAPAESGMATAFARAVCDGCGWSIHQAARGPLRADLDYDGAVTLEELYRYAARRVMWYLSLNGGDYVQTVRVSPEGDARPLFTRSG